VSHTSVLQCVAVCYRVVNGAFVELARWRPVCCSVLQCVAVCCSVLQCVAVLTQVGRKSYHI